MPEKIDVISMFRDRTVRPVRFRYAGRTYQVERLLYTWVTREGSFPVHHFAVETDAGDRRELSLNTYTLAWTLNNGSGGD